MPKYIILAAYVSDNESDIDDVADFVKDNLQKENWHGTVAAHRFDESLVEELKNFDIDIWEEGFPSDVVDTM